MALLLRYSGLRISDAVSLMRQRVTDGVLVLRTAKTGQAVRVPLPEELLEALGKIKIKSDYYFWSGHRTPGPPWETTSTRCLYCSSRPRFLGRTRTSSGIPLPRTFYRRALVYRP